MLRTWNLREWGFRLLGVVVLLLLFGFGIRVTPSYGPNDPVWIDAVRGEYVSRTCAAEDPWVGRSLTRAPLRDATDRGLKASPACAARGGFLDLDESALWHLIRTRLLGQP
jgi:hypothetical protein